jgi:hypothetical protein
VEGVSTGSRSRSRPRKCSRAACSLGPNCIPFAYLQASILVPLLVVVLAVPASAQNQRLPGQQESAVLVELIAERGLDCGLLRPWQAASLRMQTRDLIASFDDVGRAAVAAEIDARRPAMACDDPLLTTWIEGAEPNFDREHLPELLAGYRALATLEVLPAPFRDATGRTDFTAALAQINAKLAALEAAGVQPPGGKGWQALAERQAGFAAQMSAAISGVGDAGRFSRAQAAQLMEDVARIGELWLAEQR